MDFEQFQSGIDTPDAKAFQNTLGFVDKGYPEFD